MKGNVQVISMRANRLKNNATPQELLALAAYANPELKETFEPFRQEIPAGVLEDEVPACSSVKD